MTRRPPSISFVVDVGELDAALSGVWGVASGLNKQKYVHRAVNTIATGAMGRFEAAADIAGRDEIAHVYEYGQEGQRAGRLFDVTWAKRGGDMIGNIRFKNSKATVPISPVIQSSADAAGKPLAQHVFFDKASVLEGTQRITLRAGGNSRYRLGGGRSRFLVIERAGKAFFTKQHSYNNPYYNKFTEFFRKQWAIAVSTEQKSVIMRDATSSVAYGTQRAQGAVTRARAASMPRPNPHLTEIKVNSKGRPFTGFKFEGTESRRIETELHRRFEKELRRRWR